MARARAFPISHHDIRLLLESNLLSVLSLVWPVGAVFCSVLTTNPATMLGFGTWVAFGAGRIPVGFDAGQVEFDALEKTGGAKTHTLTAPEIPAHSHTYTSPNAPANSRLVGILSSVDGVTAGTLTGSAGGGLPHNNLPPYVVLHMWKRTA